MQDVKDIATRDFGLSDWRRRFLNFVNLFLLFPYHIDAKIIFDKKGLIRLIIETKILKIIEKYDMKDMICVIDSNQNYIRK